MHSQPNIFYACGSSEFTQIGQAQNVTYPIELATPNNCIKVIAGSWHTIFYSQAKPNHLSFCGCNSEGQIPGCSTETVQNLYTPQLKITNNPENVVAGDTFTLLLKEDGTIEKYGKINLPDSFSNIKKLYAKFQIVIGITNDNKILYFDGEKVTQLSIPQPESILYATNYLENGCSILTQDGTLYVYQDNSTDPINKFTDIISVASTRKMAAVIASDGRAYEIRRNRLLQITGFAGLPIRIFAGGAHFGIITYQGECWTWGCGTSGQLGTGSYSNSPIPRKVVIPKDMKIVDACAGEDNTLFSLCSLSEYSVMLPEPMKSQPLPQSNVTTALIDFAFNAPEFDLKF
ncbi:alpha-tubulin suppressor-like RCC1 family protein [Histomonas meleagridis]|uniref:alpha-tubulin suppressor-like RCC1 family protein n=1 Tax=Histomonas meleagridis TaxID=135588 RepID=UPI00355A8270|nr:alpha-tubulin suppressor-like RCC1 family protein [Histomonas meleagridis]KAH0805065.1 alpha-tubulin suppressor-like RCC1 family protein [Histomonas meleagridis]